MAADNASVQTDIEHLARQLLADTPDLFLVEVVVRGRIGATRKVEVLFDGDNGIGIDQVVDLSRTLGEELETREIMSGAYLLEVGSPGIDHPISGPRQFIKNIGRGLKVELPDGTSQLGTLVAADADGFTLQPDAPKGHKKKDPVVPPFQYQYTAISSAVVQVKF